MTARHDHQPLLHIIGAGLVGRLPCRFHQQRDGAEFVKREEPGVTRLSLDRERRFKFRLVAERLDGRRWTGQFVDAEHVRDVVHCCGRVAILDGWMIRQASEIHRVAYRGESIQ